MPGALPAWAVDATDIRDDQCLLRRVMEYQLDNSSPDSSAFRSKEEGYGLSVTLWESERDWEDDLRYHKDAGLTTLIVGDIRRLGVIVARAPLTGNLNHCELFGIGSKTPKKLKKLHAWALYHTAIILEHRGEVVNYREEWELRST